MTPVNPTIELHEFELDTGKVFAFRAPLIADYELAMQAACRTAGDNALMMSYHTQKELMKALLVEIDGHKLSSIEKESLNSLITTDEYLGLQEVVGQFMGKSKIRRQEMRKTSGAA